MIRYLLRALRAQFHTAKSLYLLTVAGVALGVASVLAIQIINRNAVAAFEGSVRAVSGTADLTVLGTLPTFPETLLVEVLAQPHVQRASPIVRMDVAVEGGDGLFLEIVGVDLLRPHGPPLDGGIDPTAVLATRGWIAVTPTLASERGWRRGDSLHVTSGTRRRRLVIGALVDFQRLTPLASRKLAVMDIAQAQALFGERGAISQIDVQLAPGADSEVVAAALRASLGPAVNVLSPEQRTRRAEGLTRAFRTNLTALSMISLFVGVFLVYASTQASLERRRTEFGVLRCLGATRPQVQGLIAAEVALLGLLGVALGIPLGYAVAAANVDLVSATLTNLYLLNEIERLALPLQLYGVAAGIGVGGALLGALLPSLDMSRRDPSALLSAFTLHQRLSSWAAPLAWAGTTILVGTVVWYQLLGRGWRPAGFILTASLLVGVPSLAPFTVRALSTHVSVRGFGLAYAVRSLAVRLQSTSVAVAALAVAVTMLTGITVMVGSFRRTVAGWIEASSAADVYITTPTWAHASASAPLDADLHQALRGIPGVRAVDRSRGFLGYIGGQRVSVAGVESGAALRRGGLQLREGAPDQAARLVQDSGAVLISEPLARKSGLGLGDSLRLPAPTGPLSVPIAGVYYDYSTEAGAVVMDLGTLDRRFGPGPINSVALYLDEGLDSDSFVDELKQRFVHTPLSIRSNRRLRQEVLRVFDETFAITRVLQGMGLLIAVAGITLTLLIAARERISELALYRALGAARLQIFGIFLGKGLFVGLLALALGSAAGFALAAILVFVINPSYFGWTIHFTIPGGALAEQAAAILLASGAASIYPALRAARMPATELSRDDL